MATATATLEVSMDTNCLEAFSDGIFAIAITLLVLEIKVPHPAQRSERNFSSSERCART